MELAKIVVHATTGVCAMRKRIPAGIVGATVSVEFKDPIWDRLSKTVVFRGSDTVIAEFDGRNAVIPWEVVQEPGQRVFFGIWGSDPESDLQLPLIEVDIGSTEIATDPNADPGTDPTLPIWAQLREEVDQLKQNGTEGPDVPGKPGEDGEDGGYYTPSVSQPDQETVQFDFSPSKPDMPAVEPATVKLPKPDSGGNVELDPTLTEEGKAADAKAVGDAISDLSAEIADVSGCFIKTEGGETEASNNLLNPAELVAGYMCKMDGTISERTDYSISGLIPVTEGAVITYQWSHVSSGARSFGFMRFVTAYDASGSVMASSGGDNVESYTVPAGVASIRVTLRFYDTYTDYAIVKSDVIIPYDEYRAAATIESGIKLKPSVYQDRVNGFSVKIPSGEFVADVENHDMTDYVMTFRCEIPNGLTGSVSLGKGKQMDYGGYIVVDASNLAYYIGTNEEAIGTYQHNLAFADYISLEVKANTDGTATVCVATNGGKFEQAGLMWGQVRRGLFFVQAQDSGAVNCGFGYVCKGWNAPTHIYGDSYLNVTADNRWTACLYQNGYNNVYLNGYSGRTSGQALPVFEDVLKHCKRPERVIWCLGMNNTDSGGVNSSWKSSVERVMSICAEEGIELILATIPNVHTVDNSYKNEYVRNSGYRYIDFASAVGASSDVAWFDGMLHSDGVHPDVQGAIALYTQAITDVPELMM